MDIFTHALAPVIIARLSFGKPRWLGRYGLLAIGLAGALPDLLNPHLSLEARHSSWSHGLPFWMMFGILMFALTRVKKSGITPELAALLALSYLFHMICDSISGGVDWLYPFGHLLLGGYFVDPVYWVPLDIALMLSAYYLFRLAPIIAEARRRKSAEDPSTPD